MPALRCLPHGFVFAVVAIWVILSVPASAANTASFGGMVVTSSGEPVFGATILYHNLGVCSRTPSGGLTCSGPTVNTSMQTAIDGKFLATGLPAGEYYLCVLPVAPNQLASCQWSGFTLVVALTEGQQINDLKLILRRGTLGVFKVRDDKNFLLGFKFLLGVFTDNGEYQRAQWDGGRQAYTLAMPMGISLRLFIDTPLVVFNDAGDSIPVGTPGMRITTAGDEMTVSLTVVASLVNAASYWPGVDVGNIASLFGRGLTNVQGVQTAATLPLPTEIAGTSVTVNGTRAPLFAVANQNGQEQINFQVPHVPFQGSGPPLTFVVNNNGKTQTFYSENFGVPGIFVNNGQPAIQHASGEPVSPSNPATPGETIVIYCTGVGAFFPRIPDGSPSPSSPPVQCSSTLIVQIGGQTAGVSFCGFTPGFVGLGQINAVIPPILKPGSYDLRMSFSGTAGFGNTVQVQVQ